MPLVEGHVFFGFGQSRVNTRAAAAGASSTASISFPSGKAIGAYTDFKKGLILEELLRVAMRRSSSYAGHSRFSEPGSKRSDPETEFRGRDLIDLSSSNFNRSGSEYDAKKRIASQAETGVAFSLPFINKSQSMSIMKFKRTFFLLFSTSLLWAGSVATAATKIACVGDSITFGAGIQDRATRSYPAQLQAMLGDEYVVKNFGVSGATLLQNGNKPYWKLRQFLAAQDFQPDIVIIKLGTNDSKPNNWEHHKDFKYDYVKMVETFQNLASQPDVYVCLPIPVFATRWGINEETVTGEVVPLIKIAAKETNATIIDLYSPLIGRSGMVPDKIHPNADGAEVIANTIRTAITGQ